MWNYLLSPETSLAFQWTTDLNVAQITTSWSTSETTPRTLSAAERTFPSLSADRSRSFLVEHSHVDPNGLPVYLDLEGNETYDYNNDIRQYVGDGLPDLIGGMNNTFRYGNWDLSALATFSIGAKIFDSSAKRQLGVVTGWNMRNEKLDRWRQPGGIATYPRLTLDETTYSLPSGFPWWNTGFFIFDASYLRLRNLTLGYNVPLGKDSGLQNCRIAVNATTSSPSPTSPDWMP